MKPVHTYAKHGTFDLTEGKIHKIVQLDGSAHVVAYFPKTYEAGEQIDMPLAQGGTMRMRSYLVTEWEEIVLCVIDPPTTG